VCPLILIIIIGDTQSAEFSHIRPLFNFVFFHIPSVEIRIRMCPLLLIIITGDTHVCRLLLLSIIVDTHVWPYY